MSTTASTSSNNLTFTSIVKSFFESYSKTPQKLKIIDLFLIYTFITGVIVFTYCCLVGTYPFNSFLAAFISTVGCFVLTVCLRIQINPINNFGKTISIERAFTDYLLCNLILHLVVFNFLG
ncbi:dolichyl-diphosphooligosaccharide-protein glycotransferase [Dictyostelium discoideum AX4]|uniref:Dolichyl-diphosphooligosaccharide--protein glycosyltransferase subunit 2 n=1 Tax=Dictyostelium discoideum TaxID=44689 RepID=DAD1_DICDI|nr:dolichyl-diphosphooligosaccharide-protein glycotransferase [Dictyostelium discoideum AX4]Q54FB6.1 RecName: Full=Dolichyl-diphosphooligosaccharide--protein glycosyltransferase subunit 2; Short=Oligosaccharyl transferase subunit 2 [Dictyostelium discoideum]EAL61955.1 dolichyl-diphosphooligosaccharide-protein glycotransferase [Dictyostelium discoideum AX4]|eukprot:XP_635421.1 dolichyl-diphosphooligosaccharide-protein glycotransferase [Dictyostelium discoideum AX4]